ncbi:polysaccharide deacetylase family protein [Granulosicoccus sp. 3-233]|uniref:polysaccharide deacetylase family protein n=1 Tax=Granulosicoccus sp. 3-233 TaxID=3417969 RepID=UPI003D336654
MTTDSPQDPWLLLDEELHAWQRSGRCATLWWRDDDAVAAGPLLDRLMSLCRDTGLLLAVIPEPLQASLVEALAEDKPFVRVAQHGYAHINHAPRGRGLGAWELGMHRGEQAVLADLDAGRRILETVFGETFLPVLVPPWNHVAPELHAALAARGYRALSTEGARTARELVPGLLSINGHCDPIRWKSGARFAGEQKTLTSLVEHLRQRRLAVVDSDEPTGFVTHHRDLDEAGWVFSERLATTIKAHPGAVWVMPSELFAEKA